MEPLEKSAVLSMMSKNTVRSNAHDHTSHSGDQSQSDPLANLAAP